MTESLCPKVAAVVVTFNRHELLLRTLESIASQTTKVDTVVVVDNAADPELRSLVTGAHPKAIYIGAAENLGPGGGFGIGLRRARTSVETQWYWMLDDDSPPAGNALELALQVAATTHHSPVGAVGLRGGHVRHGRIRHDLPAGSVSVPTPAGFLLVDGSIISERAISSVGYPRADFFIMMEDLEYSLRIGEAGLALLVRPDDGSTNLYQGSGAPWRGYYQCRNHLRLVIERRSLSWLVGWLIREFAIFVHHVRLRRWSSIRFRARGVVDAVRNHMGRVVDPSVPAGKRT